MKKDSTKNKILDYLKQNNNISATELADRLNLSRQMIHRCLKDLIIDNLIVKIGTPPKVFYSLQEDKTEEKPIFNYDRVEKEIITENFMLINSIGEKIHGIPAFEIWCADRNYDTKKKAGEYKKIFEKYESLKIQGFLDGEAKIKETFEKQCIDKILYIDFYAWEIFGKTKLGQLLLYAKQSGNKRMINELISDIEQKIKTLIADEKFDAVGFIPPTVKREVQFMKVLQKELNLSLPILSILKVKTDVIVPQKTLSKLKDRIDNADKTIIVTEKRNYKKVLLIDDAVGSGATLNQTACKIKNKKIAQKVIGLAITGSIKGFDIISEV